ncbi:MAG TPA: alpha/beta hydrolase-fold protein, partial [Acidimicrobiia bacterium]|nr:alpha/beta hydrolase-fold protein [Acidimicrobiia bacterium]
VAGDHPYGMLPTALRNLSIVDWQVRAGIAGLMAGLGAASVVWFRRRLWRWLTRALCVPLAVVFVGAAINAHFGYFPTLGALLGRTAADQVSSATFLQLEHHHPRGHLALGVQSLASTKWSNGMPEHGVVVKFVMPGTVSHFSPRTGQVYLPPIWFRWPRPKLPVIELLHGSPGSPDDWTRGGRADLTADAYAAAHDGFAPVLVMPDVNGVSWWHDSECVDGPMGNAETYLTVDVRNAVSRTFGTRRDGAAWAVAGLSEGGSCALQMGLRHPDLFGAVGDFSGDDHPWVSGGLRKLFWGSTLSQLQQSERAYDPRALLASWHGTDHPAIYFAAGRSDSTFPKMQRLLAQARGDGLPARIDPISGGHTFYLWQVCFENSLPWIMSYLDAPRPLVHHHVVHV